jgi:TPP-dependent pyruvate/acetoin dehydrogenase alpha subunit
MLSEAEIATIQAEAQTAIEVAVEFARNSPDPDPAGLEDEVYA